MNQWEVNVLYYGKIRVPASIVSQGLEDIDEIESPYLGFLLQSAGRNILVDCGISEKFIVNGRAWGGYPAEGGSSFVESALDKHGMTPEDIEMVLYTHLHNDHAGGCSLFTKANHVFQKDEWLNLLDPIPVQKVRKDYDPDIIPTLSKLDTIRVEGDIEILPGVKLYKAPGHTLGSQLITAETKKGSMVFLGDLANRYFNLFPELDYLIDLYGVKHNLKTNVELYGPAIPSTVIYDYFSFYGSAYKAKALAQGKWELVFPGHEPSLVTEFRK